MNHPPVSHSHFVAFDQCPRKYQHYYVLKDVPWETSPEMDKGKAVHEHMEQLIRSGFLNEHGWYTIRAELKLGITNMGHACDFFADNVFCRGTLDVLVLDQTKPDTAVLLDWKTGKRREDPTELRIHATLAAAHDRKLQNIYGHYVWLQECAVGPQHDLSDTTRTLEHISEQADKIAHQLKMGYMPPRQSPLCHWCRVTSCEYNPRRQSQSGHQKLSA